MGLCDNSKYMRCCNNSVLSSDQKQMNGTAFYCTHNRIREVFMGMLSTPKYTNRAKLGWRKNVDWLSVRVGKTVKVARNMCAHVMLYLSTAIIVLDNTPHTHGRKVYATCQRCTYKPTF